MNNVGGCQGLDGLSSLDGLMISDTRCWWGIGTVFPIPHLINSFFVGVDVLGIFAYRASFFAAAGRN